LQQVRTESFKYLLDVENLKKNGFINYFGMQRFGTYNVRTHQIGIENLHQNWIKVAHLILSQHPDGDIDQATRKKYMIKYVFEDGNIDEALKLLERRDVLTKFH
jgi:tRNA pseudouridine13 synthase